MIAGTLTLVAAQSGFWGLAVDLIVKGGALGLALMLTWMSFQLFKDLLAQPKVDSRKAALLVFFVFGTFGSLVGGALLHHTLTNPKVEVTLLVSPELDKGEDLPEIQAASVQPLTKPRQFLVAVRQGELVTIEVTRLLNRAREATRLKEILDRREQAKASATGEMGANDAI